MALRAQTHVDGAVLGGFMIEAAASPWRQRQGRIGVRPIADVRPGYLVDHLKWSKPRVRGASVGRPRHLLVFSVDAMGDLIIAAVAHERELLERHLDI